MSLEKEPDQALITRLRSDVEYLRAQLLAEQRFTRQLLLVIRLGRFADRYHRPVPATVTMPAPRRPMEVRRARSTR